MKKSSSINTVRYVATVISIVAMCALVVIALAMNIRSLNAQVDSLDKKVSAAESQLATYKRTMCNETFAVTEPDTLTKYLIENSGYTRTYQVHTPSDYDPSIRYPVVVSFDGINGSGSQMESYSGLDTLPAIIVYPDSLVGKANFTAWQGAPYSLNGDHDIAFVKQILETLPSQYCIDTNRIFAVGMSNGGAFAAIVSCRLGDAFEAVASVSGAHYSSCKSEQRVTSLLSLHSTEDINVPFNGDGARGLPAITSWMQSQVDSRGCKNESPILSDGSTSTYAWSDCTDGAAVRFVVLQGQPHGWVFMPQAARKSAETTAGYIWKFFEQTARPN